ncbi:unnamed protein product [Medioppia subpectinata]|uniref:Uncharacterized protein n=1 Tax=Medioppia subpectinata TaxID=1979941 RepID=A0A7R9KBG0_9ACAR|nr:unnamed protein product [Medioppia subpectinata]CAG2100218.1 unnamed protein product [Medioppia subpectinata]
MKEAIELIVVFKHIQIRRHLFRLNAINLDENEWTSGQRKQMKVTSHLVQTICFDKKLTDCLDYRRRVFNTINTSVKAKHRNTHSSDGHNYSDKCDEPLDDQTCHLIRILVVLPSMDHYLYIDSNWSGCVLNLVTIRMRVEESFSWLSTLGGAYSSLGENNIHFAIKAGQISRSQLLLASITGDPNLMAKCGIFMAYSLCQQDRKRAAIQLIRRTLHPFINRIEFCDQIVKSMFCALCYRIKHFIK